MAKLSSNGEAICEMIVRSRKTDGADADEMTCERTTIYRAMSSGKVLKKHISVIDYGMGKGPVRYAGGWTVHGKLKRDLCGNSEAIKAAFHSWQEALIMRGIDAEIC